MSWPTSPPVLPANVPGRTKSERVRAMFETIAARYDRMNRLMTFGQDPAWRRAAISLARPAGGVALDVGTGTGDLAIGLVRASARRVVAVDYADAMLERASQKARAAGVSERISYVNADALHLPFVDSSFDCVVNGFVLRNVANLRDALTEMARVLRSEGKLVCLELTQPPALVGPLFRLYFSRAVPILGGLVTGQRAAYEYLPASLGPLPNADQLAALLREVGFREVGYRRVGVGAVAIHHASL